MVISVNEIIEQNRRINIVNEQDMFYEVQCILNEGAPVDPAKKASWIVRAFEAIKKVFTDMLTRIKEFFEKHKNKKMAPPDPEFEKNPVTSEEINNLDKEPEVKDSSKVDAEQDKNQTVSSDAYRAYTVDITEYNHIFDADILDLSGFEKDISDGIKFLDTAKTLHTKESMQKFISDYKSKVDDYMNSVYNYSTYSKMLNTRISSSDSMNSAIKTFFVGKTLNDTKITGDVYKDAKNIQKLASMEYASAVKKHYALAGIDLQKQLSAAISDIESLKKSLSTIAATDVVDLEKTLNGVFSIISDIYRSINFDYKKLMSLYAFGASCEDKAITQSKEIISKTEEKVKAYRAYTSSHKNESFSIYSNLKLI